MSQDREEAVDRRGPREHDDDHDLHTHAEERMAEPLWDEAREVAARVAVMPVRTYAWKLCACGLSLISTPDVEAGKCYRCRYGANP